MNLLNISQLLLLSLATGFAADSSDKIISSSAKYFEPIKTIEFTGESSGKSTTDPTSTLVKKISYWGDGEKVRYSFSQEGTLSPEVVKDSGSYNGEFYQVLNPPLLNIMKGWPKKTPSLYGNDYFYLPFCFLDTSLNKVDPESTLRLSDYKEKANWEVLRSTVTSVQETDSTIECYLSGHHRTDNVTMKVVFDKKHSNFPVYWERFESSASKERPFGYVFQVLEIDVIPGTTTPYAKKATLSQYLGKSQPAFIADILITTVQANKLTDDDVFTIDPSRAQYIFDVDERATISVPK